MMAIMQKPRPEQTEMKITDLSCLRNVSGFYDNVYEISGFIAIITVFEYPDKLGSALEIHYGQVLNKN
jgi:hypothetical protein